MHVNLSNSRAIVTAGASGIGRAIAQQFMRSGALVAICDISQSALDDFSGAYPDCVTFRADVSDADQVDKFFDTVLGRFGGLDVLVNNAGVSGPTKPIEEITPEEWSQTLDVNLKGAFLCSRRAAPLFKAQKNGAIINLSSTAGRMGMPLRTPYSSSKYAIRGLSDTLAIELGEFGVRVNTILPGFVDGPRGERVVAEQAAARNMSYEQYLPYFLHNISMHLAVTGDDVAATATFLASDYARSISGQSIGVCGNFESYRSPMVVSE